MKKRYIYSFIILLVSTLTIAQNNVGIGTTTPNNSSLLDVTSTTRGFLPPRMTQIQMNAIASPAEGLVVYCTDCSPKGIFSFNGTNFVSHSRLVGTVSSINCVGIKTLGDIDIYQDLSNLVISVPYTGGNGGLYSSIAISSTGVTGVSLVAPNGFFKTGSGNIDFKVVVSPGTSNGTASFTINFGGQSCSFSLNIISNVLTGAAGRIWMDKNLGAYQVATSLTDIAAYGDLYQWGRAKNGHESRTSSTISGPVTIGSEPNGGLYVTTTSGGDWLTISNNFLWNSGTEGAPVKTVYDPCPTGFRVPTLTEWNAEISAGTLLNPANPLAALKLTIGGFRGGDAILYGVGNYGRYSTSTKSSNVASNTIRINSDNSTSIESLGRRVALSVRCIKE